MNYVLFLFCFFFFRHRYVYLVFTSYSVRQMKKKHVVEMKISIYFAVLKIRRPQSVEKILKIISIVFAWPAQQL